MLILIPIGITTKFYQGVGEGFIHNHLGGVIYVIFWILLFSLISPKYSHLKLIVWVFSVTCLIEFTQLIHTPILEKAREYFVFRALLGSTFNLFDILWYLVGAALGYILLVITTKKPFNAL